MDIIKHIELSNRLNKINDKYNVEYDYNEIYDNALQEVLEEYSEASHYYDDEAGFTDPELGQEMNDRHAELVENAINAIESQLIKK